MKVIYFVLTVFVSANAELKRTYLPEENDAEFRRFIWIGNENNKLKYVDLKKPIGTKLKSEYINVTYYLYTKLNRNSAYVITNNNISQLNQSDSPFNPKKQTLFISHGWINNYKSAINKLITSAVLEKYSFNVFVIDWSSVSYEWYDFSKSVVPNVGEIVAEFITNIQVTYNLTGSEFTLIGHSLGAHVAGCIGSNVKNKIKHIVGLDPALPLYTLNETDNRLDMTDAEFVEVIHTNGQYFGFYSAIGHVDYYPNGGSKQPGCFFLDYVCSHSRSYQYFAESIKRGPVFPALHCSNYDAYEMELCRNNSHSLMGTLFRKMHPEGDYYLTTNEFPPYGLKQKVSLNDTYAEL